MPDLDAGLIADFGNKVRAETFDDFLDHADAYYQEGSKQVAGVLAGVVFEDTIRRICRDKNVTDKGEDLEQLIRSHETKRHHGAAKQTSETGCTRTNESNTRAMG